jgi:hypothetical protein
MDEPYPDPIKHREIGFRNPHPDPQQAQSAVLVLADVEGVISVSIPNSSQDAIHISYDLRQICLRIVEALLYELGFHLDNSLLSKLKRALHYYTEENELENLNITRDQDHSTREIFMRCYRCQSHGCRDERPDYWRKYL